ncbi:MAG: pentapeptide repeat-containing protein, partial [Humibacillus sp.]|nr:pentapeptide repeat-containing protein [Humibacillus sp.]
LVVAYRRQRHLEVDDAGKRSRYVGAAQQLGDPEAAVRMAGAYAMAHLADEWPEQRQQCRVWGPWCVVLISASTYSAPTCAYRGWSIDPTSVESTSFTIQRVYPTGERGQHTETRVYSGRSGEREVRRTLTRIITDHLGPTSAVSWAELRLDLTGATLVDATFTAAHIGKGSTMTRAHFVGTTSFRKAAFSLGVVFDGAVFSGYAEFGAARFSGDVDFDRARFSGDAEFSAARFSGDAEFSAAFSGYASFNGARFSEDAGFEGAVFFEHAEFGAARFSGGAEFYHANFHRSASFARAKFSGGSGWIGARLPSRKVFEECAQPPASEALDEAGYDDEPDPSG